MNALRIRLSTRLVPAIAALAAIVVTPAVAQVPVDDGGAPLADYESFEPDSPAGNEDIPLLTRTELQELVGIARKAAATQGAEVLMTGTAFGASRINELHPRPRSEIPSRPHRRVP